MKKSSLRLLLWAVVTSVAMSIQAEETSTPVGAAGAYLSAMEASDLDQAETLFAAESSIFETGGVEGTWQAYRDHHIGPELGAIESFVISRGEPSEGRSTDGSLGFVAWPIEYTIALDDGRVIESRGTVTFVLEQHGDRYKIRHLHWSSRKKASSG